MKKTLTQKTFEPTVLYKGCPLRRSDAYVLAVTQDSAELNTDPVPLEPWTIEEVESTMNEIIL